MIQISNEGHKWKRMKLKIGSVLKTERKTPLKYVITVPTLQIRKLKLLPPGNRDTEGQWLPGSEDAMSMPPSSLTETLGCASPRPPPRPPWLDHSGREKPSPGGEQLKFL